jgi:hypothetical protein
MLRSVSFRVIISALVLALLTIHIGQSAASAETATPAAVPFEPGQVWAYRFVVTGLSTARAGSEVTYRVSYDLANPANYGTAGFVFVYPLNDVSFVSSSIVEGPQGVTNVQTEHSIRWDFDQRMQSGAAEVTLRIDPSATGDLTIAIYVPGTGIQLPEGSVIYVTTHVRPAGSAALPGTGGAYRTVDGRLGMLVALLALGGMASFAAGSTFWLRRRSKL